MIREATIEPPVAHISVLHDPDEFGEVKVPKPEQLDAARAAMTNAERQKKHREKDPEGYRKANRERMRRKRGG